MIAVTSMSRTTLYKGLYFGIVGLGALTLVCAVVFFRLSPLSVAIAIEGNESEATRLIEQAASLGFSRGLSDRLVSGAEGRFAKTDGQGVRDG